MTRSKKDWQDTLAMIARLQEAGISADDAWTLRRISMTLHRWHELEWGAGDARSSWVIVRGYKLSAIKPGESFEAFMSRPTFQHDDDGTPFLERHYYRQGAMPVDHTTYTPLPDRERGARARLAKIMAKYPSLQTFIQSDPRGCALYVLRPGDVREGLTVDCCYSNGIAVRQ